MPMFDVDDEVVAAVWARAKPRPFEHLTFNAAARRVLGLPPASESNGVEKGETDRKPGDYRGDRTKHKATVSGDGLRYKGQHHSMSSLARDLLKEIGHQSDFVRGPAHWENAQGVSIKDLWQRLLDRPETK